MRKFLLLMLLIGSLTSCAVSKHHTQYYVVDTISVYNMDGEITKVEYVPHAVPYRQDPKLYASGFLGGVISAVILMMIVR
jgi:hypothetical protein